MKVHISLVSLFTGSRQSGFVTDCRLLFPLTEPWIQAPLTRNLKEVSPNCSTVGLVRIPPDALILENAPSCES